MAISQYGNEYYGLSGDVKPLGTPLNGRKFTEMDTSKEYRFDAENQQWLLQSGGGGGGSSTLSGLTDVDITDPTDGQILVYNATSGKWENGAGGGGVYMLDTANLDTMTFDGQSYESFHYDDMNYKFKLVDPSVISHFNLAVIKTISDGSPYLAAAPAFVYTISVQDPASCPNAEFCNTTEITAVIVMGDDDEYALLPANGSYAPGTSY